MIITKLKIAIVAGTLLVGGSVAASTIVLHNNGSVAPAAVVQPQATVEAPAAPNTPQPTDTTNAAAADQPASTGSQNASSGISQSPVSDTQKPAVQQQMTKCVMTNGDGSIKYDANDHATYYDCPASQPAAATPTPQPTPEPTPVDPNIGVSNLNH